MNINEEELNKILVDKILETGDEEDFWDLEGTLANYKYNPQNGGSDTEDAEYHYTWYMVILLMYGVLNVNHGREKAIADRHSPAVAVMESFVGNAKQFDDITMLALKYIGK